MYELTESEGATILSVLAQVGQGGPGHNGPKGIPPSTFFTIRRKAYEAGWLRDRYVPHPWAAGVGSVECVLARPGATERGVLEDAWARSPDTVVLWSGLNSLFALFYRPPGNRAPSTSGVSVSVEPSQGSIPVYFDYSRLWAHFLGKEERTEYPRSLGGRVSHAEWARTSALSEILRWNDKAVTDGEPARSWNTPAALPRSQQRLLDWGLVQNRTFLNVESLPPYQGRLASELVYLTGKLRPRVTGGEVLSRLQSACGVSPFLLMEDRTNLLLATLGQLEANGAVRKRVRSTSRPVLMELNSLLTEIQVTIERSDSLRKVVDHRYDPLVFRETQGSP